MNGYKPLALSHLALCTNTIRQRLNTSLRNLGLQAYATGSLDAEMWLAVLFA